jgi:hypothetical protein
MSHLRVLICRVDDEANLDQMTELHSLIYRQLLQSK